MERLEQRFYTRAEIGEIIGVDATSSNFARKVKDTLLKWNYKFVYSRKGVTIERVPESIEERIAEIAIRVLKLDVQVNPQEFAVFFYLLATDDEFQCTTWDSRVEIMKNKYHIETSDKTLRNWCSKLYKLNIAQRFKGTDRRLWCTVVVDGIKYQEEVDLEDDWYGSYEKYCEARKEILDEEIEKCGNAREAWKNVYPRLWDKFHCVYYYCYPIIFNAIMSEDIKTLFNLTESYIQGTDFEEDDEEKTVRIEPLDYLPTHQDLNKEFRF